MTEELEEPTEQRRRLAALLRDLRAEADLSQSAFGERAGMDQSKVSRLETGRQAPTVEDAHAWARAAGLPADRSADLVGRAEAALTEVVSWQEELRKGLAAKQQRIGRAERAASRLRFYSVVVPGLLQTAEYARRVFSLGEGLTPGVARDVPAAVIARLERQQVLYEPGRRCDFLVPEGALRWRPGPPHVQAAQLDRIASLSTLDAVTFGVIPADTEAAALVPAGFAVLGDAEAGDAVEVVVSTLTRELNIRDEAQVAVYLEVWSRLATTAVYGDEARRLLSDLAGEFRNP